MTASVSAKTAYAAMMSSGERVSQTTAYVAMILPVVSASEMTAYVAMIDAGAASSGRRRQVMAGSI